MLSLFQMGNRVKTNVFIESPNRSQVLLTIIKHILKEYPSLI